MTRRARPIRTHLTSTHPPISCFCFAVWMLEVDNVKKKKKTQPDSGVAAPPGAVVVSPSTPFTSGSADPARRCAPAEPVRPDIPPRGECERGAFFGGPVGAEEEKRVPAGGSTPIPQRPSGVARREERSVRWPRWSPASPGTRRTAPTRTENSCAPRSTRTPRKRAARDDVNSICALHNY